MAEIVRMPKLSDTMTEGVVAKWHKKVGDHVEEGELLAEIETDKATMEFESFQEGILLYQGVKEGQATPVDKVLAIFGEKGEDFQPMLDAEESQLEDGSPKEESDAKSDQALVTEADKQAASVESEPAPEVNASIIHMPKLSDTMTEGVVAKWHKKVGDKVNSGEVLAEIETDKATMEFEAYEEGLLLHIGVEEGQSAPVDSVLAVVGEKGADFKALIRHFEKSSSLENKESVAQSVETKAATSTMAVQSSPVITVNTAQSNGRVKVSPLARKMAKDKGIPLSALQGSGDDGRIVKRDVEEYVPGNSGFSGPLVEKYSDVAVSQMRKTISKRLSESKFSAPHFYLTISLDMDQAIAARKAINEQIEGKISFNDIIVKAAALALKKHPKVNVSWLGDVMRSYEHVHIGVAVAVEEGLLVPVVRYANAKSFQEIGNEVKVLAEKARNKTLQPHEWEGSTFTISNLGMFGIEEFTAIINPPNACILAVGGISNVPVVKDGQIVPGNVMKVTLSCDHRAVDGATGSEFLATFRQYVENPITMFI
ncbi:MAG: pyruvate dehydrogenase complex dihydrolipoamide acetyltransferase [Vicingaceae bacterium]